MTDRRLFLQASAATAAAPLIGAALRPTSVVAAAPPLTPLHKLIYDPHFAESRAFAAEAERLGQSVHAVEGDITRLWTDDLRGRWAMQPVAIAGMTGQGALFCLERLAWEAGLRVVFQADHRRDAAGEVEHAVFAPPGAAWLAAHLREAGDDYGAAAARIVSRWPMGDFQVVWRSGATIEPDAPEPLVSWVIAPLVKA